jgi:ABC-type Fe3+/spermidine/putrescine transport system ATPase subunit
MGDTQQPDVRIRGVVKRFGAFEAVAGIDLDVAPGQFVTLLGPSGCGKTTTLRIIGGFETPDAGEVLVAGVPVDEAAKRHTRMVFQSYALFPHMTVRQNVAFGLRMDKVPKGEIGPRADAMLAKLGLADQAEKYPRQLSGGQQQRVALARALVTQPRVLLLDEPLGALDLKMRKKMQGELKALQRTVGITFIYVTHDQEEAMNLSDVIVVMEKGKIAQVGTPEDVYRRPASQYVADFVGETNFLAGGVSVRPENVLIGGALPASAARGKGTVRAKSFLGAATRLEIDANGQTVVATVPGAVQIAAGDIVEYGWRAEDALTLPATGDNK